MSDSNEDVCPVCGQEYVHKREEPNGNNVNHVLREDFRECRVNRDFSVGVDDQPNTVYVHRTDRVISHVKRGEDGVEKPSRLGSLLGGGSDD